MSNINRQGFTLIELIIYVAIASVMFMAISSFAFILLRSRIRSQVITEVEQQGAYVMQIITQTIRNAEGINSPTQGGSNSSLSLNVSGSSNDPTVFDVSGSTLWISEGGGAPLKLTNSRLIVSDFLAQNLSRTNTPGIIKIQFDLKYNSQAEKAELDYSKTFYGSASLR